jgi:hypothetical protein
MTGRPSSGNNRSGTLSTLGSTLSVAGVRKHAARKRKRVLRVDVASLLSLDHACRGCITGEPCCCATYEVCVSAAEMDRIIELLPEAARFCPHLKSGAGYDNLFEELERGLFALDTNEDGLCLLAYVSRNRVRCSLHAAAAALGLSPGTVKPKACLLWPMTFSDGDEVLSLTGDAFSFSCNSRKRAGSRRISPPLVEAIALVYGDGAGTAVEQEARKGAGRALLGLCRRS